MVASRAATIATISSGFGLSLLIDQWQVYGGGLFGCGKACRRARCKQEPNILIRTNYSKTVSLWLHLPCYSRTPHPSLFIPTQGKFEERQPERAAQLVELLTTLGPTFIKVGQSLSIRSDLLPLPYLEALSTLQDRVPAFDTSDAKAILARELGRPVNEVKKQQEAHIASIEAASLFSLVVEL